MYVVRNETWAPQGLANVYVEIHTGSFVSAVGVSLCVMLVYCQLGYTDQGFSVLT